MLGVALGAWRELCRAGGAAGVGGGSCRTGGCGGAIFVRWDDLRPCRQSQVWFHEYAHLWPRKQASCAQWCCTGKVTEAWHCQGR